jgi:prophage maintenance system killer protein
VDGNTRTAFAALDAFLWVNGWEYEADPMDLAQMLERVADPALNAAAATDAFEAWLRDNVTPRGGDAGAQ